MYTRLFSIAVCLVCLVLLSCEYTCAIPAFARREGVTCQMCHFRMPELNKDGHDYARRGLREEPPGSEMGMEPGEQAEMPEMPAASEHPLGVPLNIDWADYLTVMGHHMFVAETDERPLFDAGGIDLWAAGPIDPHWTGLVNPSFDIQEGGSDVDQAYGQYITHWSNRFDSGRFGQLQPFAILLNQGGPKMSLSDPIVLSTPADTGFGWTPESLVRGIEIGSIDLSRVTAYLGVGQPKLEDSSIVDLPGFERHTDFYGSGEWIIKENGDSLTVYAYKGKAWLSPAASDRSFHRLGFFGNLYLTNTKATLGFLTGKDKDAADDSLDNSGYFALVEHLFSDRWAGYIRYDHFKHDLSGGGSQTLSGPAIGASWWVQTQVRLTFEGQLISRTGEDHNNLFMTEFLWIF